MTNEEIKALALECGFKLAPLYPDKAMLDAAQTAVDTGDAWTYGGVYKAMLAAVPECTRSIKYRRAEIQADAIRVVKARWAQDLEPGEQVTREEVLDAIDREIDRLLREGGV